MRRVVAPAAALCGWLLLQGCGGEPAAPAAATDPDEESSSANAAPVIEEVSLQPARPRPGETVTAQVVASDPDGDPIELEYHWRAGGRSVEEAEGRAALHVPGLQRQSSIELTVVARDARGGESQPASAVAHVGNLPPSIVAVGMEPEGRVGAGTDITAIPRANDPEGGEIEYRFRWSVNGETLPVEGATLPGDKFKRGDVIVLEVIASDGDADSEPVVSPPIPVGNAAPRVVSEPGPIDDDGIFRYALKAQDPDGDRTFRFRLLKGPRGMTVGFDDGKVKWEPTPEAAGSHDVEVEVEDLFGGKSVYRFALQLAYETVPASRAKQEPAKQAPAKQEPADTPES